MSSYSQRKELGKERDTGQRRATWAGILGVWARGPESRPHSGCSLASATLYSLVARLVRIVPRAMTVLANPLSLLLAYHRHHC